jgi:ankyrin repeat protein
MSREDIDAFVDSAYKNALALQDVVKAMTMGIPVNGQHSWDGRTALYWAVLNRRCDLIVALLAAGADANTIDFVGFTPLRAAIFIERADILQLLVDSGGDVNGANDAGSVSGVIDENLSTQKPLIALVMEYNGDAHTRWTVLLVGPGLQLDVTWKGGTAEEWAATNDHAELAFAICKERRKRARWATLRCAWIAATSF